MSETIEKLDAVFAHAATDPVTIAAAEAGHDALDRGDVRPMSDVEMLDENRTPKIAVTGPIAKCEDCPCCYTHVGLAERNAPDGMPFVTSERCSGRPSLRLEDLQTRPFDCPMRGKRQEWAP